MTGAPGQQGPAGISSIPGEIRMWSSSVLPAAAYGKWVWCDGAVYLRATNPNALIVPEWQTFGGASDPAPLHFRVPDLRGLTPVGMDAMPGGARANRMTRQVAIILAGRAGEEVHQITVAEMAYHAHGFNDPGHAHDFTTHTAYSEAYPAAVMGSRPDEGGYSASDPANPINPSGTGITIQGQGGNVAHENVQPTVFVPYIVYLG